MRELINTNKETDGVDVERNEGQEGGGLKGWASKARGLVATNPRPAILTNDVFNAFALKPKSSR